MSKIDQHGTVVRSFSDADRMLAQRAQSVYMREIHGTGFRWEFGIHPDKIEKFLNRDYFSPNEHAREIDQFVGRIRDFGGFLADLENLETVRLRIIQDTGIETLQKLLPGA